MEMPDGRIGHAEVGYPGLRIMLASEHPEMGFESPMETEVHYSQLDVIVDDVDAHYERARSAGAVIVAEPSEEHGSRFTAQTISRATAGSSLLPTRNEKMSQRIAPYLYYDAGDAAIAFLSSAFSFEERLVSRRGDGGLLHAEVGIADDVVTLGTPLDDEGRPQSQKELRKVGIRHSSVMCFVDRIDTHYETARTGDAKILWELRLQDYGARSYSAEDPEGHVWHFSARDSQE